MISTQRMLMGALAGDVIGSRFEFHPEKIEDFELFTPRSRFTDDSVMTIAVADALLHSIPYAEALRAWGRRYPNAGYGGNFSNWLRAKDPRPYGSFGNGSAMRVSPVGWAFETEAEVLAEAERSAAVTHNHPEGIKGACAAALAIFLARRGADKAAIMAEIAARFGYDLERRLDQIRPGYHFDVTCQGSVPEALTAFIESTSAEDAIRKAVSLGGDCDTLTCITGGIAQAFYGVPAEIEMQVYALLDEPLSEVTRRFTARFVKGAQ